MLQFGTLGSIDEHPEYRGISSGISLKFLFQAHPTISFYKYKFLLLLQLARKPSQIDFCCIRIDITIFDGY